jgi:hypothetical protein
VAQHQRVSSAAVDGGLNQVHTRGETTDKTSAQPREWRLIGPGFSGPNMRIYALRPMIRAGGRPTLEADPTEANLSTHTATNSASVFISDAAVVIGKALTVRRPHSRYPVGPDAILAAAMAKFVPDRMMDRLQLSLIKP